MDTEEVFFQPHAPSRKIARLSKSNFMFRIVIVLHLDLSSYTSFNFCGVHKHYKMYKYWVSKLTRDTCNTWNNLKGNTKYVILARQMICLNCYGINQLLLFSYPDRGFGETSAWEDERSLGYEIPLGVVWISAKSSSHCCRFYDFPFCCANNWGSFNPEGGTTILSPRYWHDNFTKSFYLFVFHDYFHAASTRTRKKGNSIISVLYLFQTDIIQITQRILYDFV